MQFTSLYFDLDDTLYPPGNGLWDAIRDRMTIYLTERLGFPADQVPVLRRNYYETYGTTLRGLQANHQVDTDDYLAFVHDLPLSDYLYPDPELRRILLSLPQRRWIFTNSDASHSLRVLRQLGLEDCFHGILDVRSIGFLCKPMAAAYQKALEISGNPLPEQCVLFEDSSRNLAPARELGFLTVLVGSREPHPAARLSIANLHDLPAAMPQLWEGAKNG